MAVALLLAALPALPGASASAATDAPLSPSQALTFCRAHPYAQETLSVHGWIVTSLTGGGYVEGGVFDSRYALPLTTVDQWDVNGHWREYGALYAHITTRSSFNSGVLTLHGRLDCATARFWTDRDPLPPPRLATVYGTARITRTGAVTTWASAGGMKLTLTVPRRSYPRNALAQVTVSIENVSGHTIGYWVPGVSLPGFAAPQAQVIDSRGRIAFPPAMPYMPPLPGPAPGLVPLLPGRRIALSEYIVVRGAAIRASEPFTPTWSPNQQRPPNTLVTHPISVRLTTEPLPRLALRLLAGEPAVDVIRPAGEFGRLLWLHYADCGFSDHGPSFDYNFGWVAASTHLAPGCSPVRAWHFRLAWLDHPVAALDYTAPTPTPTPLPSPTPAPATPTATTPPAGGSFAELLGRAAHAMASVHTMHTAGNRWSVDSAGRLALRIAADCRSQRGNGIPITARTLISGQRSGAASIDEGYILQGPILPRSTVPLYAWHRSTGTQEQWRAFDPYREWSPGNRLSNPVWALNPAYLNQVCPDLLVPTYLASPLPHAGHTVIGRRMLSGHQVWLLREHLWFTLDLYLDARSFAVRRLDLWDRPGPATSWELRFDYTQFNAPLNVAVPPGQTGQIRGGTGRIPR